MVNFRRTHYRISLRYFFARGVYRQEGPAGQRGLLARGAYWPEGPSGQRGPLVSGGGFGPGGLPLGYAPGLGSWSSTSLTTAFIIKGATLSPKPTRVRQYR